MKKVKFIFDNLDRRDALHYVPDGEKDSRSACIKMYENGSVIAERNIDAYDNLSDDVWQERTLVWRVSPTVDCFQLKETLASIEHEFQAVLDGHRVAWDGFAFRGSLTDEADEAHERISAIISAAPDLAEIPHST